MYKKFFLILVSLVLFACSFGNIEQYQDNAIRAVDLTNGPWKHYKYVSSEFVYVGKITFEGNEVTGRFTEKYILKPERKGGYVFSDNYLILDYDDEQDHVEGLITEFPLCECFFVADEPIRKFIKWKK